MLAPRYQQLKAADLDQLNRRCEEFTAALTANATLRAEDFASDAPSEWSDALLEELLLIECECSIRTRSQIDHVALAQRFPGREDWLQSIIEQAIGYAAADPSSTPLPSQIGPYMVQSILGQGGFGTVYHAIDPQLRRDVAIKIPHPHLASHPKLAVTLHREARKLAGLKHPNLVTIYATGFHEGRQYLVMEYVPGFNLGEWLYEQRQAGQQVSPVQAAQWIHDLAIAVEWVHHAGIRHCDIKPGNILLDQGNHLIPRLTDFGLAQLVDDTTQWSVTGKLIGTPQYMAPEQAGAYEGRISPATDIYSLGAVLYELLTGYPPVTGQQPAEMLQRIVTLMPPRPRTIRPDVPRDLEAICWTCLQKSPDERYSSAWELAEDLDRLLHGQPVRVALPGPWRRFWSVVQQHQLLSITLLLLFVALFGGLFALLLQEKRRVVSEAMLRAEAYPDQIRVASLALARSDRETARRILDSIPTSGPLGDLRGFEWRYLRGRVEMPPGRILTTVKQSIYSLDVSPDQQTLAFGGADRTVRVVSAENGAIVAGPWELPGDVVSLSFSPNGQQLAIACADRVVRLVTIATGQWHAVTTLTGRPHHVVFHPQGEWLAIGGDDPAVSVMDLSNAKRPSRVLQNPRFKVRTMDFALSGDLLVFGTNGCGVHSWRFLYEDTTTVLPNPEDQIHTVRFAPSGSELLVGSRRSHGLLTHAATAIGTFSASSQFGDGVNSFERINDLAWSRDGRHLAVARESGVDLWDWPKRIKVLTLSRFAWRVYSLRFVGHDRELAMACDDGTLRVNRLNEDGLTQRFETRRGYRTLAFLPDGQRMTAAFTDEGSPSFFVVPCQPLELPEHDAPPTQVQESVLSVFSCVRDVRAIRRDRRIVIQPNDGPLVVGAQLEDAERIVESTLDFVSAMNRSGELYVAANAHTVGVWDTTTGKRLHTLSEPTNEINSIAIDDMGRLAIGCRNGQIRVRKVGGGDAVKLLEGHNRTVRTMAFTTDGKHLISGGWDREVRVWSLADGRCVYVFDGHGGPVHTLAISPDNRTIAVGCDDGTARLWHLASGLEMVSILTPGAVRVLAFDAQGKKLAIVSDVRGRNWNATEVMLVAAPE